MFKLLAIILLIAVIATVSEAFYGGYGLGLGFGGLYGGGLYGSLLYSSLLYGGLYGGYGYPFGLYGR